MRFLAYHRIGQIRERAAKLFVRQSVIPFGHGSPTARERFFSTRQRSLASRRFARRNVINLLRVAALACPC